MTSLTLNSVVVGVLGSSVPLRTHHLMLLLLLLLFLRLVSQGWWRERCLLHKMSGCLGGSAGFNTFLYYIFGTSLFNILLSLPSSGSLCFVVFVLPCCVVAWVLQVLYCLYIVYIYISVRFVGWLAWCLGLAWGPACHGSVDASKVLLLLRLVIYLWDNVKMTCSTLSLLFCAFIRTVINQRFCQKKNFPPSW